MDSKNSPEIKFTETLLDYGAEILVAFATDEDNRKLFAIALGRKEFTNPYLVVHVSDEIATRLKNATVDVLSAILTPATPEWIIADFNGNEGDMIRVYEDPEEIPIEYLPSTDFYLR